jgi:hypothetical protein
VGSVLLILLTCCTPKKLDTAIVDVSVVQDSARLTERGHATIETENATMEEDCVFHNDYRTLTAQWISESKVESFEWNDAQRKAVILLDGDTLLASQGGCEHFGIYLELRRSSDAHAIADSAYWINESLQLAEKFGLAFYATQIKAGNVRRANNENQAVWYEFVDDDPEDNLYYNGIEIASRNNSVIISISQYYN